MQAPIRPAGTPWAKVRYCVRGAISPTLANVALNGLETGLLAHLGNVDAMLKETLKIADLVRVEVHGPAAELDKLRQPLAGLKPQWFVLEPGGLRR